MYRLSGLLAAILALLSPRPASAAVFGLPGGPGGGADGWFLLIGEDADVANNAYGDVNNELTLYIEVTGNSLNLCIYDPGIWSAAQPGLDFTFDAATPYSSFMDYALYAPGSATPLRQDNSTWGPDTAATDQSCLTFYNGPATPGVYRFVARMPDGPGVDQDVNVFGIQTTPDYAVHALYATVGHSNWTNARLQNGSLRLYPWASSGSRGLDRSGNEVCGLDVITWDLDGPTQGLNPPDVTLITRLLWMDGFEPSLDGTFRLDHWPNMAPLNASDDFGVYSLTFARLGIADGVSEANHPSPPVGFDFNAFSLQVWSLGQLPPSFFSDYPILPPDPRMSTFDSRRIYLPQQGSAPPLKEYVGHAILNPPVGGRYNQGQTTPVDVAVILDNPTGYALSSVAGRTVVAPSADLSAPRNVSTTGGTGGVATPSGKTVDFSFATIPAGTRATVRYTVDFTPQTVGYAFLTGDGTDFMGGAAPTSATWDTPFAVGEAGRPCAIQTGVIAAPCSVAAVPAAPARACRNETITLDGSGSTKLSCAGALEYRWTGPGLPPSPPFAASATAQVAVTASGPQVYTLEVRCSTEVTCTDTSTTTVQVSAGAQALADPGPDRVMGSCDVPFRIGTPGDTAQFDYAWSPPALVSDPAIPQPDFIQSAVGSYSLTLTVTSKADALCSDSKPLQVQIGSGSSTGSLGNRLQARKATPDVTLLWPLGIVAPDRYNVNRATAKLELDKSAYTAPVRNAAPVLVGDYTDAGAMASPPSLYYYEVWGRDCAGLSVIQ